MSRESADLRAKAAVAIVVGIWSAFYRAHRICSNSPRSGAQ
jgi:hypothetical protein